MTEQVEPLQLFSMIRLSKRFGGYEGDIQLTILTTGILCLGILITAIKAWTRSRQLDKEPEWIPGGMPFLGHFYTYIFHNLEFMKNVQAMTQEKKVMRFKMGFQGFYVVSGAQNVQAVLRNTTPIRYLTSNGLVQRVLKQLEAMTDPDLAKFKLDNSGRAHVPLPGTNVADSDRLWSMQHRIFVDNLSTQSAVEVMTAKFIEVFTDFTFDTRPVGHVEDINMYNFIKEVMVRSATTALCGRELLRMNPDFVKAYWDYDSSVFGLIFGIPRFIYPKAYDNRDRWHKMGEKWLKAALQTPNWDAPDQNPDWDDMFGLRFTRERMKFFKRKEFDTQSRVGMHLGTIWALNTNTIPIVGWMLLEIIRSPSLYQEIRTEALTAFTIDPPTSTTSSSVPTPTPTRTINMNKLTTLPLLQSIYIETLRLHDSINVTREVTQDMILDGYTLKKGYLIQAPSYLSHHHDSVWKDNNDDDDNGEEHHPADEFWAKRHIVYKKKVRDQEIQQKREVEVEVPEFEMRGDRAKYFFPYGGGLTICPGRHIAKREIMAAIATIVVNFDIELIDYIMTDGSGRKADRLPLDDPWYGGFGSMAPDREVRIRWTRI